MQSVSPSTRRLERRLRRRRLWETVRALAGFATARMREANLVEVASSMTLTTLLSLVPLMAVSLAVFAAFPSFADARAALEDAVLTSFLPTEQSETIVRYIKEFSSHASGLGVFGLAGLSLTALLMIDKLFVTMNRIFKVRRMRPWSQRALLYWAILTLAPIVIALSITLSTQAIRLASGAHLGLRLLPDGASDLRIRAPFQVRAELPRAFSACACRRTFRRRCGTRRARRVRALRHDGHALLDLRGVRRRADLSSLALSRLASRLFRGCDCSDDSASHLRTVFRLVPAGKRFSDRRRHAARAHACSGSGRLWQRVGERVIVVNPPYPPMTAAEIADEVDSYPQAVENLLVRLAAAGYAGEVPREEARAPAAWALVCDPSKKTLRDAFRMLLVDGANTLVRPKGLRAEAEGMLGGWFAELERSTALDTPLESLFASA